MGDLQSRLGRALRICSGAAAVLMSGAAVAEVPLAPVQYYVNVQPIQVCATDGPCAPVSEPGSSQIGFVDPSGVDITRAILNQAGIDVNFFAKQTYNTNSNLSSPFNTLQITPSNVPDRLNSADFSSLSDQAPPNPIKGGNSPTPAPPLSLDPHTVNMFFINSLSPAEGVTGTFYGLAWIGNNGASIAMNSFGNMGPRGLVGAVPDALAHEMVHNLGLDHSTDNDPQQLKNLMSVVRNVPTIATELTRLGAGLGAGTADQLNSAQVLHIIDPTGARDGAGNPVLSNQFLNPIPKIDTQISDKTTPADFSVSFQNPGRSDESLQTLTLTTPAGFLLEFGTFEPLGLQRDTPGIIANPTFANCTSFGEDEEACQSLTLAFAGVPFVLMDQFDYTVDVCRQTASSCDLVPLSELINDLTGGTYKYQFSDGYQTTSVLRPLGDPILDANSWTPDLTTPTGLDLSQFTPFFSGLPCIMQTGMTACPDLDLAAERYDLLVFETPEPPNIAIIFVGLGLWLALDTRRRGRSGAAV
jgi:hypothetical protein